MGQPRSRVSSLYFSFSPSFFLATFISMSVSLLSVPEQREGVFRLIHMTTEGDQVDLQLLQVIGTAKLLFNRCPVDIKPSFGIDLHHGRIAVDDGVRVVN